MSRISLKSLSEHLGLSPGTVSRALNNYTDISPTTRARVKAAAEQLGYRPNSSARRLATGNAEAIGFVLPSGSVKVSEPILAELVDGLAASLSERQWDLTLSVPRTEAEELAIINRLAITGRIDGLVVSRTRLDDPRIKLARSLHLPVVSHGRTRDCADHAWFDIDNESAFTDAADHLVGLGHRQIAFIGGPLHYSFSVARRQGYHKGLAANNLPYNEQLEEISSLDQHGGQQAMMRLLTSAVRPTAVLCCCDAIAIGAMFTMRANGILPGRDISVIGYDGLPIGEHLTPRLSTMAQPLREAGLRMGRMLLAIIDGEKPIDHQVLESATLLRRDTDQPPPHTGTHKLGGADTNDIN